ncbi:hypothetical protein ACQ859_19770 [Roseateles chitinivorans]|uniref:hypothetical protein n=1 Tax=Roseateles chitinivorans TaxID=2917965 RepID=UPI003D66EBF4
MSKFIMLIRHAEKPTSDAAGVNVTGVLDAQSLSVPGWRRAGALVRYFGSAGSKGDGGPIRCPRHIVAARPTGRHPSTRPADTVRPLAEFLGLPVDERWSDQDAPEDVAAALRALDGPVLVCWRHHGLPRLADAILQDDGIPSVWPAERFDVTWSFFCRRHTWTFAETPQLLLPGDLGCGIDPVDPIDA